MTLKKERKLNRWQGYDYSMPGLYFVTVCTKNKQEFFGEVKNNQVYLNDIGQMVLEQWMWLPKNFKNIKLDEWIIMPNHVHGIIEMQEVNSDDKNPQIHKNVGTGRDLSLQIKPLYDIIGAFKTTSSKLIHQAGYNDFVWQRSFYDRVIRSDRELNNIRQYITHNPNNWQFDQNNPINFK